MAPPGTPLAPPLPITCLTSTSANRFFSKQTVKMKSLTLNLEIHKVTDPDDIPVLVLNNCRLIVVPWLAKLINECFVLGVFQMFLR